MITARVTKGRRNGCPIGECVELVRYRTAASAERRLYVQRVDRVVRVIDVPADGSGRAYLVERGLEQDGYAALLALVRDYVDQAARLGIPPMAARPHL